MASTFNNQLTNTEIIKGLFVYVNRKMYFVVLACMAVVFAFSYFMNVDRGWVGSLLLGIFVALTAEIFIIFLLKQQFSSKKTALYTLREDSLEIVNSNGIKGTYAYNEIEKISLKDLFILSLSKNSFAIVSKNCMTKEQIALLNNSIQKN